MANTNINIRMDTDLKKQVEAFCADMGMTMTTAFNIFARKAVREYRIPFEISGDVPNAETMGKLPVQLLQSCAGCHSPLSGIGRKFTKKPNCCK